MCVLIIEFQSKTTSYSYLNAKESLLEAVAIPEVEVIAKGLEPTTTQFVKEDSTNSPQLGKWFGVVYELIGFGFESR